MPIYKQSQLENLQAIDMGIRVDCAAADITIAAFQTYTIVGGNVLMTGFYGQLVEDVSAHATILSCTHTPTVGTATLIAIAAAGQDIQGYISGRYFYLPVVGGVMAYSATGYCRMDVTPNWILRPGVFTLFASADPTTGRARSSMFYVPVDYGAYVTTT
jgi:hypothetical protein